MSAQRHAFKVKQGAHWEVGISLIDQPHAPIRLLVLDQHEQDTPLRTPLLLDGKNLAAMAMLMPQWSKWVSTGDHTIHTVSTPDYPDTPNSPYVTTTAVVHRDKVSLYESAYTDEIDVDGNVTPVLSGTDQDRSLSRPQWAMLQTELRRLDTLPENITADELYLLLQTVPNVFAATTSIPLTERLLKPR